MVRNAAERMVGEAVLLTRTQAVAVLEQFEETSAYRSWQLAVAAVMANHFHAVVGVGGDPESETLLRDLKSYASRRLNREFGRREWWTKSGSKRKLPDEPAVIAAVRYVREQKGVLASFTSERWA
ncbi:MAG: transposase [Planctomycetota bacterium]